MGRITEEGLIPPRKKPNEEEMIAPKKGVIGTDKDKPKKGDEEGIFGPKKDGTG